MKICVKLGRSSKLVDFPERSPSTVTLAELSQTAAAEFELDNHNFQLSLNKTDALSGDNQNLSEIGLVSGDIVHIIGSNLPVRNQPAQNTGRRQPLSTFSPRGSERNFLESRTVIFNHMQTNITPEAPLDVFTSMSESSLGNCGAASINIDISEPLPSSTSSASNEIEGRIENVNTDVNRYLQEPLVVRESTASHVPILLHQLYSSVHCASNSDALWVAVHALMIETGFVPAESSDISVMPDMWKRPGFFNCTYTYSIAPEVTGSCSLSGVTLGQSIVIHGIPKTETGFKPESLQLNSCHYVRTLSDDVPSVYRALDKLSRQVKDTICLPLINEIATAAGFKESQGFLALPCEITVRVLTYLDAKSLCYLGRTCQEMNGACTDRLVWRRLYIKDFGCPQDSSLRRNWFELYRDKYQAEKEEQRRRALHIHVDPMWHMPGAGPFRPYPPMPFPSGIIGGDYDLNPEFAAGLPNPLRGWGGNPLHLPRPGNMQPPHGLDPFSANPLRPSRHGINMTGSPFGNPFQGPFL